MSNLRHLNFEFRNFEYIFEESIDDLDYNEILTEKNKKRAYLWSCHHIQCVLQLGEQPFDNRLQLLR